MTLVPSALPKSWFGPYRHTVPGALHCCLLSSGFCTSQPPKQHISHCAAMLPAAPCSAFTSGVHHTECKAQLLPTSVTIHLLPSRVHTAHPQSSTISRGQEHLTLRAVGAAHTCARQLWPHWFYWGSILPSVSLPNAYLVQSQSVKADQNLLPDSLKDPHKVPQYPHCLSQETKTCLPHNHVLTLSLAPPSSAAVVCAEQQGADSALKPQTLPCWMGSVHR